MATLSHPTEHSRANSHAEAEAILLQLDSDQRRQMIAEAAYYRWAARNFADGFELEDWLEAEAEIDHLLHHSGAEIPGSRNLMVLR